MSINSNNNSQKISLNKYMKYKEKYSQLNKTNQINNQHGGTHTWKEDFNDYNKVTFEIMGVQYDDLYGKNGNKNICYNSTADIIFRDVNDPSIKINNQVLILFGEGGSKFESIKILMKNYHGPFIYFRDTNKNWYDNKLAACKEFMEKYIDTRVNKYIFLGISMGGYAALYLSVLFPDKETTCIAITPQTVNYNNMNNKIYLKNDLNGTNAIQPYLANINLKKNIPAVLIENYGYKTKIYVLIGKSECGDLANNKMTSMFSDSFHAAAIINHPNVNVAFFNKETHVLSSKLNLNKLYELCYTNFDTLFNNQSNGIIMLGNLPYHV